MPGILEMLELRKAQLEQMQKESPEEFAAQLQTLRGPLALIASEVRRDAQQRPAELAERVAASEAREVTAEHQDALIELLERNNKKVLAELVKMNRTLRSLPPSSGGSGSSSVFDLFDGPDRGRARNPAGAKKPGVLGRVTQTGRGMISRAGSAIKGAATAAGEAVGSGARVMGRVVGGAGKVLSKVALPLAAAGAVMGVANAQEKAEQEGRSKTGAGASAAISEAATLGLGSLFGINSTGDIAQAITNAVTLGQAKDSASAVGRVVDSGFDSAGRGVEKFMDWSGVGDAVGMSVAAIMSPFSKDARESLSLTWKNQVIPSFDRITGRLEVSVMAGLSGLGDTVSKFSSGISDVADTIGSGASSIAGAAWTSLRAAGSRVVSGDFRGAASEMATGAKRVYGESGKALGSVGSAVVDAYQGLGRVSAHFESGKRGVGTVSTGAGDFGGVSYGKHQLSSKSGTMDAFLKSEEGKKFAPAFEGKRAGSAAFNQAYRDVASTQAADFEKAQQAFIKRTHFDKAAVKLNQDTGLDVSKRGAAVQEAVFSTAVQYGPGSSLMTQALKSAGIDPKSASDAQIVSAIQDYKAANVDKNFRSSSAEVKSAIAGRAQNEKQMLLALDAKEKSAASTSTQPGSTAVQPTVKSSVTQATGSTARPESSVKIQPSPVVASGTPALAKRVAVTNPPEAPQPAPQRTTVVSSNTPAQSVSVGLDEIPVFFPHLSMLPVLTGRV